MVRADPKKGKAGKLVLGPRLDEDDEGGLGEGGSKEAADVRVEEGDHLVHLDRGLYEELSAEQRAVDKAMEE